MTRCLVLLALVFNFISSGYSQGKNEFKLNKEDIFKIPEVYSFKWSLASDSKKKFRYFHNFGYGMCQGYKYSAFTIGFTPRMRFSDRFSLTLDMQYEKELNTAGWVETGYDALDNPIIYFGRRDISTWNNIITATTYSAPKPH